MNIVKLLTCLTMVLLSGCAGLNTFPTIARSGDTVSLMIAGSEKAKKENVNVSFTDASGQVWDLQALGLVRSVFNLRADGRAHGLHYAPNNEKWFSWAYGHEPVQTVLVTDLPIGAAAGPGAISISLININDNSSGAGNTISVNLEIIPGTGAPNQFQYSHPLYGDQAADFTKLEAAPHAKITFPGSVLIGAASLVIGFDTTVVVRPGDINLYVPESTTGGSYSGQGKFGKTQRMIYWRQDGQKLYVDIIAPQGIDPQYLQFFVMHPRGLTGSPAFNILSAQVYGTDGSTIAVTPTLTYSP